MSVKSISIIVQKYYKFGALLLAGGLSMPIACLASPQLLAQQRGLPPPPPSQRYNPPPALPDRIVPNRRYAVYINGDSPLLLKIVRQIEPNASVQRYKKRGVILAGYFFDESSAQQRALQLQSRGIQALITNFSDREEFSGQGAIQQPNFPPVSPSFTPPRSPSNSNSSFGLYQVFVDANSASLSQVQRIEPTAFTRQYRGRTIVQAGSFADEFNARQLVEVLARRGIRADIVRSGQDNAYTPNQPFFQPPQNLGQSNYYFVVISGKDNDLSNLAQRVVGLGIPPENIFRRNVAGDPHVAVGPFSDRQTAENLRRYLGDSGIQNLRLSFGR